jgi:hypothetical protein
MKYSRGWEVLPSCKGWVAAIYNRKGDIQPFLRCGDPQPDCLLRVEWGWFFNEALFRICELRLYRMKRRLWCSAAGGNVLCEVSLYSGERHVSLPGGLIKSYRWVILLQPIESIPVLLGQPTGSVGWFVD